MAIGYRAIFRLNDSEDAVVVADEQLRSWFESKRKSGVITNSEWLGPGLHRLGPNASLRVSQLFDERDGSRRQVARYSETNDGGQWEVSVIAVSLQQARVPAKP